MRPTVTAIRRAEGWGAAAGALRWLVPTAAFEALRRVPKRYVDEAGLRRLLTGAGLDIQEVRRTFLGGVSVIAWARRGASIDEDGADGASSPALQPVACGQP